MCSKFICKNIQESMQTFCSYVLLSETSNPLTRLVLHDFPPRHKNRDAPRHQGARGRAQTPESHTPCLPHRHTMHLTSWRQRRLPLQDVQRRHPGKAHCPHPAQALRWHTQGHNLHSARATDHDAEKGHYNIYLRTDRHQ